MKTQLWSKCCISYFRQREFCRVPSSTQVNWELDIKGEIQRDICPVAWGTDQNTAWEGSREVNPSCSLKTALKMAFVWQRISFTNPKLMGHCGSEKMPIEMGNGSCFCFLYIKLFSETFKWPSHGYWTFYHLLTFKYTNGCPKEPPHIAKEISSINHLLIERLKKETKNVDEHQIFFKYCEGLKNMLWILAEISLLLAVFTPQTKYSTWTKPCSQWCQSEHFLIASKKI